MMTTTATKGVHGTRKHRKGPKTAPERSCVVCRAQKGPLELVRLMEADGLVAVGAPLRGRGAWVCATRDCLSALSSSHVSRAFRKSVVHSESFLADLRALAAQRVLEMVGLARRQNALVLGSDAVQGFGGKTPSEAEELGVVMVAEDVAERTHARYADAWTFAQASTLGHACGAGRVGVLWLKPGPLAVQAAYWLMVWYEGRPSSV